jgi:nicotinate phosphoribosyltransferase
VARALLTDLYELNMAASYLRRGIDAVATFSLFVRRLPPQRAFLVSAGIDECLDWLEQFRFDEEDLAYARELGFARETLDAFSELRFTGDVWAVPEGHIVFAGEPLLEVSAPMPEAQLAETFLLNRITFQLVLASKAARCRIAARGAVQLVEFGFRRTHGLDAGLAAARLAALVGFDATSNVEAARRYGLRAAGTMAHSYIEVFPTEKEAFRAFAADLPGAPVFLVDTYDTLRGIANAIQVVRELGLEASAAVRIDSGDLEMLCAQARTMLDEAGLREVKIFVSGGLDERDVEALIERGTPFDAVGLGTRVSISADAPYVDSVYKLVEFDGRPVMKLSSGKSTLPGAKQVFRSEGLHDLLGLRSEPPPAGHGPLLVQMMANGTRIVAPSELGQSRARFESDLAQLPGELKTLDATSQRDPELTSALEALRDETAVTSAQRSIS